MLRRTNRAVQGAETLPASGRAGLSVFSDADERSLYVLSVAIEVTSESL